jgi:hypothetical protein
MRPCIISASHFYRANFIPEFTADRGTMSAQIPAMMPGLFKWEWKVT